MNKSINYTSILFFFLATHLISAQEIVNEELITDTVSKVAQTDSTAIEVSKSIDEEKVEVIEEVIEEIIAEEKTSDKKDKKNEIEVKKIKKDSSIFNLKILSTELESHNFFLSGENHTYSSANALIKDQFIQYLHQNAGVKNVVMEFGYVTGYLIDRYAYYNDTTLVGLFDQMPNQSYYNIYDNLRRYNLKQSEDNKIHVFGIDAQKTPSFIFLAIDYLRKKKDISLAHDSIQLHLETIHYEAGKGINREKEVLETPKNPNMGNFYWRNNSSGVASLKEFKKNYNKFSKEYKSFFGTDSLLVDRIAQTSAEYIDYKRYTMNATTYLDVFRERIMIREFTKIHAQDSTQKYFAQFGKCHTAGMYSIELCERYNFENFADRLRKTGMIKPLVIGLTYDSEYDQEHHNKSFEKALNLAQDRPRTLARYEKTDTTYSEPDYIMIVKSSQDEGYEEGYEEYFEKDNSELNITLNYIYGEKVFQDTPFDFAINPSTNLFFNEKVVSHGGALTFFESQSGFVSFSYSGFNRRTTVLNDSLTARFKGYKTNFLIGYEATKSDVLNLAFYMGLGYSKIEIDLEPAAHTVGPFLMDDNNPVSISNNAFLLDVGADLNLSVSYFNIGIRGGYDWDFSMTTWDNAPTNYKTTFRGLYANAYIGLRFRD